MDTANHIGHFDSAGLNPEGTSQIDMKEFTVSHAVTLHIGGEQNLRGVEELILLNINSGIGAVVSQ